MQHNNTNKKTRTHETQKTIKQEQTNKRNTQTNQE